MPGTLEQWKTWLHSRGFEHILECTCPYAHQGLGRLYGVSFGKGWVRLSTTPGCPEHDQT